MTRRLALRSGSIVVAVLVAALAALAGMRSTLPVVGQGSGALPLRLEGRMSLSPLHGPWGTQVTASASGLTPNAEYEVVWTTATGAWKLANNDTEYQGRVYTPVDMPLARVQTDASGALDLSFTVPEEFGFQHDIQLRRGGEIRNKAGFDVDMQVTVTPTSGPAGTPITIEAKGVGWRTYQNSWVLSYDNTFTGWLSAVTTKGYAKAVIPATGSPGVHILTVLHGDFTFPYMNMQQSPEPDRPQFRVPFTITEGEAVLPPSIERQFLPVAGTPRLGDGIAVWVDPPEGVVGSTAIVRGQGLPPNAEIDLTWTKQSGNRVSGAGFGERGDPLAKVRTDAGGAFAWRLDVPDDLGGYHPITASAGGRAMAGTTFTIQASAQPLSVARGPSGTPFSIQLNGVGWTETANIYHVVWDNAYSGYACGFNSNGNVQINMTASGAPGWHFVDVYPGIYKGTETRPLNFRIPQLTYEADHPGEDLPAFRFAFFITAPGQ